MGLFYNFTKPGPGVEPDEPKKEGIALFVQVIGRKFFKIIESNMMYFLVSIPFFAICLFFLAPQVTYFVFGNTIEKSEYLLKITMDLIFAGVLFNCCGSGPAAAAYAYIVRSFTRGQHVWIISDGFDKFKENYKKSLLLVALDCVVITLTVIALRFYKIQGGEISRILYILILVLFALYIMAHIFMYQIIVTYECGFITMIKSSFIFTLMKLPMCLLLMTVTTLITAFMFGSLGVVSIFVYGILGMMLTKFPLEFYAARVIDKNIEKTSISKEDNI